MKATTIKRGDKYSIPIAVMLEAATVNIADIDMVEFCLGDTRKLYPDEVTYDPNSGFFYFPLTQEETLSFGTGSRRLDVRVKFVGGDVKGVAARTHISVVDAISKEVI